MRSGEAKRLKWLDIDSERCIITLNEPRRTQIRECSKLARL